MSDEARLVGRVVLMAMVDVGAVFGPVAAILPPPAEPNPLGALAVFAWWMMLGVSGGLHGASLGAAPARASAPIEF